MAVLPNAIATWAHEAARGAEFETLSDGTVFGRVPACPGAVATGADLSEARETLYGVLEDWARVGLQLGDEIPIIGTIDLNAHDGSAITDDGAERSIHPD
jgi:predicted RNase H-like HicB family nuclease